MNARGRTEYEEFWAQIQGQICRPTILQLRNYSHWHSAGVEKERAGLSNAVEMCIRPHGHEIQT